MVGRIDSGGDLGIYLRLERERCAKIADEIAAETGDGEGELYIARKIANKIRALNVVSGESAPTPKVRKA